MTYAIGFLAVLYLLVQGLVAFGQTFDLKTTAIQWWGRVLFRGMVILIVFDWIMTRMGA